MKQGDVFRVTRLRAINGVITNQQVTSTARVEKIGTKWVYITFEDGTRAKMSISEARMHAAMSAPEEAHGEDDAQQIHADLKGNPFAAKAPSGFMTPEQVATEHGVNVEVIRRILRDDVRRAVAFPHAEMIGEGLGGIWRIPREDADAWTAARVGKPRK